MLRSGATVRGRPPRRSRGNPPNRVTDSDLLALTLLDVAYGPRAVRRLLEDRDRWSAQLGEISTTTPLWKIDRKTYDAADTLWPHLTELPGVGPTKAGKPGPRGLWWELAEALQDWTHRERIDRSGAALEPKPSTLRLLDVATQTRCRNSTNARNVRFTLGFPAEPLTD